MRRGGEDGYEQDTGSTSIDQQDCVCEPHQGLGAGQVFQRRVGSFPTFPSDTRERISSLIPSPPGMGMSVFGDPALSRERHGTVVLFTPRGTLGSRGQRPAGHGEGQDRTRGRVGTSAETTETSTPRLRRGKDGGCRPKKRTRVRVLVSHGPVPRP